MKKIWMYLNCKTRLFYLSYIFQVAMAGDYILAVTSMMIARLNHNDVTITLSQVCVVLFLIYLLNEILKIPYIVVSKNGTN